MQVFISHARDDAAAANVLADELRHAGMDIWELPLEATPGESYLDLISAAIAQVDACVMLLSAAFLMASYTHEEITLALDRRRRSPRFRLVPILLEPVELPASLAELIPVKWSAATRVMAPLLRALR